MSFVAGGRFPGALPPGYVTIALSRRVPQHILDLPRPMQHLLHTRHGRVQQIRAPNTHIQGVLSLVSIPRGASDP
jgi:hypothetical protein